MASSNKRIMAELAQVNSDPLPDTVIRLPDESNVHHWEAIMTAPAESPYAGGKYIISITLPKEYPFKPPVVSFKTKIFHPNVTNDDAGSMCLGILRADTWKPPNRIKEVVGLIREKIITPDPDDAVEGSIAQMYKTDRKEFNKQAREWVKKYAS